MQGLENSAAAAAEAGSARLREALGGIEERAGETAAELARRGDEIVAEAEARTTRIREAAGGIVDGVAAASESGAQQIRAALEALAEGGVAISAARDNAIARVHETAAGIVQEVGLASERGVEAGAERHGCPRRKRLHHFGGQRRRERTDRELQATTNAAAVEMQRAEASVRDRVVELAQIADAAQARLEGVAQILGREIATLRETGTQVGQQVEQLHDAFAQEVAHFNAARGTLETQTGEARVVLEQQSQLLARSPPTPPNAPTSPTARSRHVERLNEAAQRVAVQSETLGGLMQRQLAEMGRAAEHIGTMGTAIDETLKASAEAIHDAADKSALRAEDISRLYSDRSRGIEEMTVASVQRIVERTTALEEHSRLLDQAAEKASAQIVDLAKQFDETSFGIGAAGDAAGNTLRDLGAAFPPAGARPIGGGRADRRKDAKRAQHAQRAFRRDRGCHRHRVEAVTGTRRRGARSDHDLLVGERCHDTAS